MKKIIVAAGIFLFVGSIFLSSCKSSNRLCPAYPPTPRQGASIQNHNNNNVAFVVVEKDIRF
jgi:uncharacterized lipoprotein YajG